MLAENLRKITDDNAMTIDKVYVHCSNMAKTGANEAGFEQELKIELVQQLLSEGMHVSKMKNQWGITVHILSW